MIQIHLPTSADCSDVGILFSRLGCFSPSFTRDSTTLIVSKLPESPVPDTTGADVKEVAAVFPF